MNSQTPEPEYKYDIAISFCNEDLTVAEELAERLRPRYNVFVYTQYQDRLTGGRTDEEFRKVFLEEARLVVVLYRDNWGKTPSTLVEEEAIRDRMRHGHEWYLFVKLDQDARMPEYLPLTYIYYAYLKFGMPSLLGSIDTKIQKLGGEAREESLVEMLLRAKKRKDSERDRLNYLSSKDAKEGRNYEHEAFFDIVFQFGQDNHAILSEINIGWFTTSSNANYGFSFYPSIVLRFRSGNFSEDDFNSTLWIELLHIKGGIHAYWEMGRNYPSFPKHMVLAEMKYAFDFNHTLDEKGWREGSQEGQFYTSAALFEKWFRLFAEYAIGERKVKGH